MNLPDIKNINADSDRDMSAAMSAMFVLDKLGIVKIVEDFNMIGMTGTEFFLVVAEDGTHYMFSLAGLYRRVWGASEE